MSKARKYYILVGKHESKSAPFEFIFGDYERGPVEFEREVTSEYFCMMVKTLLVDTQAAINSELDKLNA